jgi:hypothetical protein
MAARNPPGRNPLGTGMLRLLAATLFIGAPILALIFRSWGLGALVFGLGAIVLGIRQIRLGVHRSERFLGVALLLGGAYTAIDGLVHLLFGVSP